MNQSAMIQVMPPWPSALSSPSEVALFPINFLRNLASYVHIHLYTYLGVFTVVMKCPELCLWKGVKQDYLKCLHRRLSENGCG